MKLMYGMNVHLAENVVLEKMRDAGIEWFRIDVNWYEAEPEKSKFNWQRIDRVINFCITNSINIYATIGYAPKWASGHIKTNYPAININDWTNFVKVAINRYKGKITHWGIWNEMNLGSFWGLDKRTFVEKVFLPAVNVIKEIDTNITILGPEITHSKGWHHFWRPSHWYYWMKYLLKHCSNHYDIFTHHIYDEKKKGAKYIYKCIEKRSFPFIFPSLKQVLKKHSKSYRQIWITETGWHMKSITESQQAEFYNELIKMREEKKYPQNLFFYSAFDDPNPNVNQYGILQKDYSEKESYHVLKKFIKRKNEGRCLTL